MFTDKDIQLLNTISQSADMAKQSIQQIIDKTDIASMQKVLQAQLKNHNDIYEKIQKMLHFDNIKVKQANPISKFQAQLVSNVKTMTSDNPTSKIAEMMIQGTTMGITEVTKELHEYDGSNLEIKVLAQQYLESLQKSIDEMKPYL